MRPYMLCRFNPSFDKERGHWDGRSARNLWGAYNTFAYDGQTQISMDGTAQGVLNTATFVLLPGRVDTRYSVLRWILVVSYAHVVGTKPFAPSIRLCEQDDIIPFDSKVSALDITARWAAFDVEQSAQNVM